ncbi:hypothetical protein B9Z65_4214 [Elsinoe australis]|uniref:WKF domain-containing protein n=1 Tax=Elsinoe australis TaxID=40998 RepID=A0A2P7Z256_9PEZI|nr:hypothetical protein B9Z65_4214 [Elsinoe australis]
MSVTTNAKHVPAWKRLGLKLKNPQIQQSERSDSNFPTQENVRSASNTIKTDLENNVNSHEDATNGSSTNKKSPRIKENSKKRKRHSDAATSSLSHATPLSPGQDGGADGSHVDPSAVASHPHLDTPSQASKDDSTQPRKKRSKSVTFANDTKTADGNSAKSFAAPSTDPVQATDGTVVPTIPDSNIETTVSLPDDQSLKQPKGRKERTKDKGRSVPVYVEYLSQFYNDKDHWKFNKSKQTDLLKNIWNTYRVPSEYDDALVAYIQGLQGEAARQRLRNEATGRVKKQIDRTAKTLEEAKPAIESDMTTRKGRKAAARRALQEQLRRRGVELNDASIEQQMDEDERRQATEDERAERILYDALQEELTSMSNQTTRNASLAPPTRKSRKSRTTAESSSDSSSDSSSSDETTSSEESSDEDSDEDDDSDDSGSGSGSESGSDSSEDGKIFSKKWLDKVKPKEDYSHLKARAAEIKQQRRLGRS